MKSTPYKSCVCRYAVEGAPFQPQQRVKARGQTGTIKFLDYEGCGQTFPDDPLCIVLLDEGQIFEYQQDGYWKEELISIGETK